MRIFTGARASIRRWLGSTQPWTPRPADLIAAGAECDGPPSATQIQSITSTIAYVVNGSRVGHSRKGFGIIGVTDVTFAETLPEQASWIDCCVTLPGQRKPTDLRISVLIKVPE